MTLVCTRLLHCSISLSKIVPKIFEEVAVFLQVLAPLAFNIVCEFVALHLGNAIPDPQRQPSPGLDKITITKVIHNLPSQRTLFHLYPYRSSVIIPIYPGICISLQLPLP